MLRKWLPLLTILVVLALALPVAAGGEDIGLVIHSRLLESDVPTVVQDGRILAPLRASLEALGSAVGWDEATQTITAVRGERTVVMTIDQKTAYVNGAAVELDVAPTIRDGRTLVPLRFLGTAIGDEVHWSPEARVAVIGSPATLSDSDPMALAWLTRAALVQEKVELRAETVAEITMELVPGVVQEAEMVQELRGYQDGEDFLLLMNQSMYMPALGFGESSQAQILHRGGRFYMRAEDGPWQQMDAGLEAVMGLDAIQALAADLSVYQGARFAADTEIDGQVYKTITYSLNDAGLQALVQQVMGGLGAEDVAVNLAITVGDSQVLLDPVTGGVRHSSTVVEMSFDIEVAGQRLVSKTTMYSTSVNTPYDGRIPWPTDLEL